MANLPNTPDTVQDATKLMEEKILHVFQTYPTISPSMLQITLGSSLPTAMWKPVLEALIEQGKLFRYFRTVTNPNGRSNSATILSIEPELKDVTVQ